MDRGDSVGADCEEGTVNNSSVTDRLPTTQLVSLSRRGCVSRVGIVRSYILRIRVTDRRTDGQDGKMQVESGEIGRLRISRSRRHTLANVR